jgi:hypothetical protein
MSQSSIMLQNWCTYEWYNSLTKYYFNFQNLETSTIPTKRPLLQFMVFLFNFLIKKYPKWQVWKKPPNQYRQIDLDLLTWLGSQFEPYHFD